MTIPTILIADDDRSIRTVLTQALGRSGYQVRATGSAAMLWRWVEEGEGDLVITDVVMPDDNGLDLLPRIKRCRPELRVIVMSAQSTLMTAVKAAQRGAFEYLPKPFDLGELLAVVGRALAAPAPLAEAGAEARDGEEKLPLLGRSQAMQDIYRTIARLTTTDLTVMVNGESGTGKELVARALHDYGRRRAGPFVAINMAAIPRELIESELFGHERGSFTGAHNRSQGRFEQAAAGTLFLDEIGDMPPEAQTRLLRVLQEGEFTSVGGRAPIRANVRIVAATHRDLRQAIQDGTFREDLFYRLNVVPIRLPPLRERLEDIPVLARHFLDRAKAAGLGAKLLDDGALDALRRYRWPGNVRELENLMRRLAALTPQDVITAEVVAAELRDPPREPREDATRVPHDHAARAFRDHPARAFRDDAARAFRDDAARAFRDDPARAFRDDAARAFRDDAARAPTDLAAAVERHIRVLLSGRSDGVPTRDVYDQVIAEVERPLIRMTLAATRGNQIRAAELLGLNRNTLRKKIKDLDIPVVRGIG